LAIYGYHRRALQAQDVSFKAITSKGGTISYSRVSVFVDFSLTSAPAGMGFLCSNEKIICPDYRNRPDFGDADLPILENIINLHHVDFSGSQVSKAAAFRFREAHPGCSIGFDSVSYVGSHESISK
jgi:hypothetical protein